MGIRKNGTDASNLIVQIYCFYCPIVSNTVPFIPSKQSSKSIHRSTVNLFTERKVCPDSEHRIAIEDQNEKLSVRSQHGARDYSSHGFENDDQGSVTTILLPL